MTPIAEILSNTSPPAYTADVQNMSEDEYGTWQAKKLNDEAGELAAQDGILCGKCKNKGIVYRWDSELKNMRVSNCECMKARNSIQRIAKSNVVRDWREKTFLTFNVSADWQMTFLRRVQAYADCHLKQWMLLTGQSGCGKTHLATAAFIQLIQRQGYSGEYVRWADFVEKSYSRYDADEAEISKWTNVELLYIDDLFKKRGNAAVTDREFDVTLSLIDARYTDPDKLTIISTERSISDLREMDEALAGRIQERCGRGKNIIQVKREPGRNYRLRDVTEI